MNKINNKIYNKLCDIDNLQILSTFNADEFHIISFNGKFFSLNFILALLNDIFIFKVVVLLNIVKNF